MDARRRTAKGHNILTVKARPGVAVPMEHDPRRYITASSGPVKVPGTPYYLRRLQDGDLVIVMPAERAYTHDEEAPNG